MRRGFAYGLTLLLTLWGAAPADAAWDVTWVRAVVTGGGAFDVETTDPNSAPIQDVESRQRLNNNLTFDNAYLHMGLLYEIMRVDLQDNRELSYLDHQVGINFNVDRWLRRYTEDGRLTVKATAQISPSLPPIDPDRLPTGDSGRDQAALTDLSQSEFLVHHDILNIEDDPTGYTIVYGLAYSDELGPYRRYDVGWDVEDNRYDSTLVQDSRVLRLHGRYTLSQLRGESGFGVSHNRQLGEARFNDVYGLSVFRAAESRRWTWHVEPGITYQPDGPRYRGSFNLALDYTMPRATIESAYSVGTNVSIFGQSGLERIHRLFLGVRTNRNYRSPRWMSADLRVEESLRQLEFAAGQRFQFFRSLAVVFQYSHSGIWWDDGVSPERLRWESDRVGVDLQWEF